jgi:hypothetical protein
VNPAGFDFRLNEALPRQEFFVPRSFTFRANAFRSKSALTYLLKTEFNGAGGTKT